MNTVCFCVMGSPVVLKGVAARNVAARVFSTHRQPSLARLAFGSTLVNVDAPFAIGRSGLPAGAVGGFFLHVDSVFFLTKKGIANAYEKFVVVRNAPFEGDLWTA